MPVGRALGVMLVPLEGYELGKLLGAGDFVGGSECVMLGWLLGFSLGSEVGSILGADDGPMLGVDDGCPVGGALGSPVGLADTVGGAEIR